MIRYGQKTFELQLYDEKRQKLRVGNEIEFSCLEENRIRLKEDFRFNSEVLFFTWRKKKSARTKNQRNN